jgi:hypothetical protein
MAKTWNANNAVKRATPPPMTPSRAAKSNGAKDRAVEISERRVAARSLSAAAKSEDEPITIALTKSKETKGTFVYNADDADAAIPTIYIRKSGFDGREKITVIVK